jgi:hypothetical protein
VAGAGNGLAEGAALTRLLPIFVRRSSSHPCASRLQALSCLSWSLSPTASGSLRGAALLRLNRCVSTRRILISAYARSTNVSTTTPASGWSSAHAAPNAACLYLTLMSRSARKTASSRYCQAPQDRGIASLGWTGLDPCILTHRARDSSLRVGRGSTDETDVRTYREPAWGGRDEREM